MKVTGPSNYFTRKLIRDLRKTKRRIWRSVAKLLMKPARQRHEVNLYRLNRITKKDDVIVVPGKILGMGNMDHPIVVGAFKISKVAREKLEKANCTVMTINELVEKYPTGSGVRIII